MVRNKRNQDNSQPFFPRIKEGSWYIYGDKRPHYLQITTGLSLSIKAGCAVFPAGCLENACAQEHYRFFPVSKLMPKPHSWALPAHSWKCNSDDLKVRARMLTDTPPCRFWLDFIGGHDPFVAQNFHSISPDETRNVLCKVQRIHSLPSTLSGMAATAAVRN